MSEQPYLTHPAVRMDQKLAEVLHTKFDLQGLTHEHKVVALTNLMELYHTVQKTGWHVHTGDWDWLVTVTMVDGTEYATINQCYDFDRLVAKAPWTACVDYASLRTVRVWDTPAAHHERESDDHEDYEHIVEVAYIASVDFERLD